MVGKNKILVSLVVIIGLIGMVSFLNYYYVEDVIVYETDVNIGGFNEAGFNLDPDKLHFGIVPYNSPTAFRMMDFNNNKGYPLKFTLKSKGDMADWLYFEVEGKTYKKVSFQVDSDDMESIKIKFNANSDDVQKDYYYTGEIIVVVKRTTFLDSLWLWIFS